MYTQFSKLVKCRFMKTQAVQQVLTFAFWLVSARICEAVQAGGPVDPAGRVQMAEETLSQPAPDLQRLLQTARHHRYHFTRGLPAHITCFFLTFKFLTRLHLCSKLCKCAKFVILLKVTGRLKMAGIHLVM